MLNRSLFILFLLVLNLFANVNLQVPSKAIIGEPFLFSIEVTGNDIKLPDLNTTEISSAIRIVEGTARNMGITITD